jgi:hypothetical protein
LDGPLQKVCPAVVLSHQDGCRSAVALLLKAALIQVSDYRLLRASGIYIISPYIFDIYIICPFIFDIYIISLVYLIFILPPIAYLICLLTAGLDTQDLTLHPTDQHLVRLAGLISVDAFYKLVIHLGLSDISWNNILVQYQGYDQKVVNFVALCEWRQQKYKNMETTLFKDLSDALTEVDYNQHVLCQVGNN